TLDCWDGMFSMPAVDALSQQLAQLPQGGAIATFSASTVVNQAFDPLVDDQIFPTLADPNVLTVGDFTQRVQTDLAAMGSTARVLLWSYNLIGDPATRLPLR